MQNIPRSSKCLILPVFTVHMTKQGPLKSPIADFEELLSFFPKIPVLLLFERTFQRTKKRLHLCWFQIRSYLVEDQSLLSHPSHKHDVSIYGPCKQATWSYMPSCWHYKFFSDYVIAPSVLPCPLNEPPCCQLTVIRKQETLPEDKSSFFRLILLETFLFCRKANDQPIDLPVVINRFLGRVMWKLWNS